MASNRSRILIADDDPDLSDRIGLFLGAQGYQVDHASDGQEALSKIRSTPPHLVILDAVLPKLSGFQIARLLKFDPHFSKLLIVMMTVLDQPSDKERAKAVGVDLYLTKPFTDNALLQAIKKLLG